MQRQCRAAGPFFPLVPLALAGGLALALGAGCRQRAVAPPRPAPRWAGVALRVAAPDGPARELLRRHGAAWANATGATLAPVPPPAGDDPAADLLLLPPAELPRWAAAGKLRPLPQPVEVETLM